MKRLFYSICVAVILFIPIRVSASDIAMGNHDTIYKPGNVFIFEAKIDSFSVTYRYNEQLGLVEAIYDYNHEVRIQLSLINVL